MRRHTFVLMLGTLLIALVVVAPTTQAGLLSGLLSVESDDWDGDGQEDDTEVEVCTGDSDDGLGGVLGGLLSPLGAIGDLAYDLQESLSGSLGFDTFYLTVDVCGNDIPLDPMKVYR